jgi:hypothetical protein
MTRNGSIDLPNGVFFVNPRIKGAYEFMTLTLKIQLYSVNGFLQTTNNRWNLAADSSQ